MSGSLSSCSGCGGRGRGLARSLSSESPSELLCLHCKRQENARVLERPADVNALLGQGFRDLSPEGDWSLLKKVVRPGADSGSPFPSVGCPAQVHYVGRCGWDASSESFALLFETSRDLVDGKHAGGTDDAVEVHLGRFTADAVEDDLRREAADPMHVAVGRCAAWDPALLSMRKGERAEFVCAPSVAYGAQGRPPKVGPNERVLFELELLGWDRALPAFPSREAMAQSKLEREEEDRLKHEANPPASVAQRIEASDKDKDAGNAAFKTGDYAGAKVLYDRAFVSIYFSKDEWDWALQAADRERLGACKTALHLNRALCRLKLECPDEALWDCEQALELDPGNVKALFRRCQTNNARLSNELKKEENKQFWVLEKAHDMHKAARADFAALHAEGAPGLKPLRAEIQQLGAKLKQYSRNYRDDEKRLFKDNIFAKVQQANKSMQQAEEKQRESQQQTQDLQDLPEIE